MAERLAHRGPDERTAWSAPSGRCALGHSRLRVIDLAGGGQPMPNESGSVQAVFNGEIYNFKELRAELEQKGHRFRSRSDTEVLVHGYEAWGDALPERLDGMFAFAVWDETRRRLLLARDRAGKKPLFLARAPGLLAFGSEIKALLAVPEVRARASLDGDAFPFYLTYGYVPAPRTFYQGVVRVSPATAYALEEGGELREWCYWRLDRTPRPIPYRDAMARVREVTRAAVAKRMVADVPLGAFLSADRFGRGGRVDVSADDGAGIDVLARLRRRPRVRRDSLRAAGSRALRHPSHRVCGRGRRHWSGWTAWSRPTTSRSATPRRFLRTSSPS